MVYELSLICMLIIILIVSENLLNGIYDFVEKDYIVIINDKLSIVIFIMGYIVYSIISNLYSVYLLINWYMIISNISVRIIGMIIRSLLCIENKILNWLLLIIYNIKRWSVFNLSRLVYISLVSLITVIILCLM